MISIITPVYNGAQYIEACIKTVIDQHHSDIEHIIVDGGSTDGTVEIISRSAAKYGHLRWVSEKDMGQSDAMNKGFEMSSGDIIVYLNVDDYFNQGAFDAVLPYFDRGAQFVVGKVKIIKVDGSFDINDPKTEFKEMLRWWEENSYCHNPVGYFYRREVQEAIGGFNSQNHYNMDLEFLLEVSRRFTLTKIDFCLGVFRLIEGTKTFDSASYEYYDEKYSYLDKYLIYCDPEYVRDYLKSKNKYLRRSKEDELTRRIITNMQNKNYVTSLHLCLRLFQHNPLRFFYRPIRYSYNVSVRRLLSKS